jgi:hypothetical protein
MYAAKDMHTTIEELLETVLSMQSDTRLHNPFAEEVGIPPS